MPTTRRTDMPAPTRPAKPPVRPVRITLPADCIATIDQIAANEMISRVSWIKRSIGNAVRFARWQASLNKQH